MNYYEVIVVVGHVGRGYGMDKAVPIVAENGKDAAMKARWLPRVKHDYKYAIRQVRKVDETEYQELIQSHRQDSYFRCRNKQEQNAYCKLGDEIYAMDNNRRRHRRKVDYHHRFLREEEKYEFGRWL